MQSPGRLAFFLPSLAGGGAERVMLHLARGFAARGVAVDLVLAEKAGPYLDDVPQNVRLLTLGSRKVSFAIPRLISYFRRERPRAVISAMTHANLAAIIASQVCRGSVPIVATEHIALAESQVHSSSRMESLLPPLARLLYPKAHAIIAVSHGVARQLETTLALPHDRISVVYNPVVSDGLFESANEPIDHPWFSAGEPPVVVAVGRLSAQKDFDTLVRAFACVRQRRMCRLLILGDGDKRAELHTLIDSLQISRDAEMPGFVRNPYKFMRHAELLVVSSRFEGLPTVIIEAMACGTPVVSTDCPSGPSEILENGRWGRLVPVGDVAAMAQAIEATLDEPSHPDVQTRAQDFTIEKSVDDYLRVIDAALAAA